MDLSKNRYSSQFRMDNDKKSDWFKMLDSKAYMWDRRGDHLEVFVGVDRYFELEQAIKSMGGRVLDHKFDKISGKDYLKVKEPKF